MPLLPVPTLNVNNFRRYKGDSSALPIELQDPNTGDPFNPTDWVLVFTVKRRANVPDQEALIQKISTVEGITVTNAAQGKITVQLLVPDFEHIYPERMYVFDVRAQNIADPELVYTVAIGTIWFAATPTHEATLSVPTYTVSPAALINALNELLETALDDLEPYIDEQIAGKADVDQGNVDRFLRRRTVVNISDLNGLRIGVDVLDGEWVDILGYYVPGDVGMSFRARAVAGSSATVNGGSVHAAASGGRFFVDVGQVVDASKFGAKTDGSDASAAFTEALKITGRIIAPPGNYYMGAGVPLPSGVAVELQLTGAKFTGAKGARIFYQSGSAPTSFTMIGGDFDGEHIYGSGGDVSTMLNNIAAYKAAATYKAEAAVYIITGARCKVTMRGCVIRRMIYLPVFFTSCADVLVEACEFYRCLDPGFVDCDGVVFARNFCRFGIDNGVSVSRRCRNVTVEANNFLGYANGVWIAGFDIGGGNLQSAPRGFTVRGNKITGCYKVGIEGSYAPRNGTISDNVIRWSGFWVNDFTVNTTAATTATSQDIVVANAANISVNDYLYLDFGNNDQEDLVIKVTAVVGTTLTTDYTFPESLTGVTVLAAFPHSDTTNFGIGIRLTGFYQKLLWAEHIAVHDNIIHGFFSFGVRLGNSFGAARNMRIHHNQIAREFFTTAARGIQVQDNSSQRSFGIIAKDNTIEFVGGSGSRIGVYYERNGANTGASSACVVGDNLIVNATAPYSWPSEYYPDAVDSDNIHRISRMIVANLAPMLSKLTLIPGAAVEASNVLTVSGGLSAPNPGSAWSITSIVGLEDGGVHIIRNANATNAITFTHDTSAIRTLSGSNFVLGGYKAAGFMRVSSTVWQQIF